MQYNEGGKCVSVANQRHLGRPGPGWKYLAGGVYEHVSGVRITLLGGLRLTAPSYRYISANDWPEIAELARLIKINGGNRKRGLMAWARKFID